MLKGFARSQPNAAKCCLPNTANIMLQILTISQVVFTDEIEFCLYCGRHVVTANIMLQILTTSQVVFTDEIEFRLYCGRHVV